MAISAAGYIAVRLLGARFGLPNFRSCIRLYLKYCNYRRNGCASCKGARHSRGSCCRRRIVNDCDNRPDGACPCRHEHDEPSSFVDTADLRRLGRASSMELFLRSRHCGRESEGGLKVVKPLASRQLSYSPQLFPVFSSLLQRSGNGLVRQVLL